MPRSWILKSQSLVLLAVLFLVGCKALNPFCGSARPKPVLTALAPTAATFAEIQAGLVVTVTGSRFVSSSVILWNGVALPTTVTSSTQLQVTVTTTQVPAPGNSQVAVHTPANTSGDLGCDNGGNSQAIAFTVT
jgi:trimeric autotransporter adhesin